MPLHPLRVPMAASLSFTRDKKIRCKTRSLARDVRYLKTAIHRKLRRKMKQDLDFIPLRGVTGWDVV